MHRIAKDRQVNAVIVLVVVCFVVLPACLWTVPVTHAASNIDGTNRYAWSETAGWLNFRAAAGEEAEGSYGVMVGTQCLSGYAWAENIGWIRLGAPGAACPYANDSATNYGVNVDGEGNCSGYAWSENAGWINFSPGQGQQVILDRGTGLFDGYAWGENVGYVHMRNDAIPYAVQVTATGPTLAPIYMLLLH